MVSQIQLATQELYDQDYYLWLQTTVSQLRTGRFSLVDLDNLIESDTGLKKKTETKGIGKEKSGHFADRLKMS